MGQMHTGTQQRATAEIHTAAKSTQRQQLRAHRDSSGEHTETAAESTQQLKAHSREPQLRTDPHLQHAPSKPGAKEERHCLHHC